MAMAFSKGRGGFAEINVTPMADVVIVLLIIMMIAVPMLDDGRVRDLPQTVQADRISGPIVLSVAADSSLDIGGRPVPEGQLLPRLREALSDTRDGGIQLKVDRGLPFRSLAPVLAACREAGAQEVAFVTVPRPGR